MSIRFQDAIVGLVSCTLPSAAKRKPSQNVAPSSTGCSPQCGKCISTTYSPVGQHQQTACSGSGSSESHPHLCMHHGGFGHGRQPHHVPPLAVLAHHRCVRGLVQELAHAVARVVQARRRPRRPQLLQAAAAQDSWVSGWVQRQTAVLENFRGMRQAGCKRAGAARGLRSGPCRSFRVQLRSPPSLPRSAEEAECKLKQRIGGCCSKMASLAQHGAGEPADGSMSSSALAQSCHKLLEQAPCRCKRRLAAQTNLPLKLGACWPAAAFQEPPIIRTVSWIARPRLAEHPPAAVDPTAAAAAPPLRRPWCRPPWALLLRSRPARHVHGAVSGRVHSSAPGA